MEMPPIDRSPRMWAKELIEKRHLWDCNRVSVNVHSFAHFMGSESI
jgi:hypothetical protein